MFRLGTINNTERIFPTCNRQVPVLRFDMLKAQRSRPYDKFVEFPEVAAFAIQN
jgi:hypothetical protein